MIRGIILLSLGMATFAQWEIFTDNQDKRGAEKYCGDAITKTLGFLCEHFYNSPYKKSYDSRIYDEYRIHNALEDSKLRDDSKLRLRFPFSPRSKALTALEYRRKRKGVHDECCMKSCSINELKSYCGRRN